MSSIKDNYLMKKITICNNIDKNNKNTQTLSINTEKITKPNMNLKNELTKRLNANNKEIQDLENNVIKRINNPYKGIIKDFDYNKEIKGEKDITIYVVNSHDKDITIFNEKKKAYDENKKNEEKSC